MGPDYPLHQEEPMTTSLARRLTVLPVVLAPTLMGAALLTDITPRAENTRELLDLIAREPGAWTAGQTLFFLAGLMWVPAGLLLMRLFGRGARVGRVAAAAVAVGGLAVLLVDAGGLYLRELALSDIPVDQQVSLVEAVESSPALLVFEAVHIAGLFLGLVVLGVAMLRHDQLPRLAGALVILGILAVAVVPPGPLLAAAAVLLVAGLSVAAGQLSRPVPSERQPLASAVVSS
jgi:hypothetical protein